MKRGDVVIIDFPYSDGIGAKFRPVIVVQDDRYNATWKKTVVVMVTGNIQRKNDPAHLLIDTRSEPGTGLKGPSLASCLNLFTVDQTAIQRKLGRLSEPLLARLDRCLVEALGIR